MTASVNRQFAEEFMKSVDDPGAHGVHILFNQFWQFADAEVIDKWAATLESDATIGEWVAADHYAEPLSMDDLASCPGGSLGAEMRRFIVENGLEAKLAMNYRQFHESLRDSGTLDNMPEPMQYAVLRGFQTHDFLHVVSGYESTPFGELALQAFSLAQLQFPYFAMWMAVTTARMTFIDPDRVVGTMDALAEGWSYGRAAGNLTFERWESRLAEPLVDLRAEFGIAPAGRKILGSTAST